MSVNVNVVLFGGNLTRDPELKYTDTGVAVSEFTLAYNRTLKRSGKEDREETVFLDVTTFGKLAETCAEWLKKGRAVIVEGHLVQERWEDQKTQQRRSKHSLTAERVNFCFPAEKKDAPPPQDASGSDSRPSAQAPSTPA